MGKRGAIACPPEKLRSKEESGSDIFEVLCSNQGGWSMAASGCVFGFSSGSYHGSTIEDGCLGFGWKPNRPIQECLFSIGNHPGSDQLIKPRIFLVQIFIACFKDRSLFAATHSSPGILTVS